MDKILTFTLAPLHSSEHFQFMYETKVAIATYTAQVLGITDVLPAFLAALEKEDVALRVEQGSAKSELAKNLELLRGRTWKSADLRIDSALNSPFSDEVESGKVIRRIFDVYGDIRRHPVKAESAEITNLLTDLMKPEVEPHLIKLNLQRLVPELGKENNDYMNVVSDRNVELAGRASGNTDAVRIVIDPLYEKIVEVINAQITLNLAQPAVAKFVSEHNMLIKTYEATLAARETLNQNSALAQKS